MRIARSGLPSLAALAALVACAPSPWLAGGGDPPFTPPTPSASVDAAPPAPDAGPPLAYPAAKRADVTATFFGTTVHDPYRWLEDAKSPETQAFMTAENDLARRELGAIPERAAIAARLKELAYYDLANIPLHRKGRYFWSQHHADKEKSTIDWSEGRDGPKKVLLDPNTWSTDGSVSLGDWSPSPDGKKLAYTVKQNNADEATLYVVDVASGEKWPFDVIPGAKYAHAAWTDDSTGFYYTWITSDPKVPQTERPGTMEPRFHVLGTKPELDVTVHDKTGDPATFLGADVSKRGWVELDVDHGWRSTDVYLADARAAGGTPGKAKRGFPWIPVVVGKDAHYSVQIAGDRLFISTDEGAPNGRVFRAEATNPGRDHWTEIIPTREGEKIASMQILGGKLALLYLKAAHSRVEIHDPNGALAKEIAFANASSAWVGGREDDDEAYLQTETYSQPKTIEALSMKTFARSPYAKMEVPFDGKDYVVDQIFYPSKDGTRVSMFVVRKKDVPLDGSAPTLLYGYGGFNTTETPSFRASIVPWVERGGIYAVPNLRGGGEYGEEWHKAGMLTKKQNVFDDFIAAADTLIQKRYTSPKHLAIWGASNGGLLVAAAVTQKPEDFAAALCGVPLTDMVRYREVGAGKTWTSEYGSPDKEDEFKALFAYSPYHHVTPGKSYPALLLLSADSDDRVDPMHARKFAAALQNDAKGGPFFLRIEKNSGHGGAGLIKAYVEQTADTLAFALAHTR